jgi:hypothetical protein
MGNCNHPMGRNRNGTVKEEITNHSARVKKRSLCKKGGFKNGSQNDSN